MPGASPPPDALTEEELLDRARTGDRLAFGALYLRHREVAMHMATRWAASPADAEEAVAEGFARVLAALPRTAGRPLRFRPYLLACVRNVALDRRRHDRRFDLHHRTPEPRESPGPDDIALGFEDSAVAAALQALPRRWRSVLWLTEVEGLSPTEVSRLLGTRPNAVAALAYRARNGLRQAYHRQLRLRAEAGCWDDVPRTRRQDRSAPRAGSGRPPRS